MKNEQSLEKLNMIFDKLGPHGGSISIENDWTFYCRVNDLGDGDHEAELFSAEGVDEDAFKDPFFRVEISFNEDRSRITDYCPIEYLSQWWGGELRIDPSGNACDSAGNTDSDENDLEERLSSYLDTITQIRPYLTEPKSEERYERDIDRTYLGSDKELKPLKKEAMSRMRILGVSEEDVDKFAKGELTKIYVDHENRKVRREEFTPEDSEIVKKAEKEAAVPFMAYYLIVDTITFPDGETDTRYIIPYVWDEKWDSSSNEDYEAGQLWGRVREDILTYKALPCYTVNLQNPEYSEFGELPYRVLNGMLFTLG